MVEDSCVMREPPDERLDLAENSEVAENSKLRQRLIRLRAFVKRALPFVSGVLAALVALLLYSLIVPKPHQITQHDIDDSITNAMASATPAPAYSALVYQAVRPSL